MKNTKKVIVEDLNNRIDYCRGRIAQLLIHQNTLDKEISTLEKEIEDAILVIDWFNK